MTRLRRPLALSLATIVLAAVLAPVGAIGASAETCTREMLLRDECGGGGGGPVYEYTTTTLTAPVTAPFSGVPVSSITDPPVGSSTLFVVGPSQVYSDAASVSIAVPESTIGTAVVAQSSYPGNGYYVASSSAPANVYIYGSDTVRGTVVANGAGAAGLTVQLMSGATAVATTTTTAGGAYSFTVAADTVALASATYSIRAQIGGTWQYAAAGGATTATASQALLSGPTQWRPSTSVTITGVTVPVWGTTSLRTTFIGEAFSYTLPVSSSLPVTYSIAPSSTHQLPAGLTLDPSTGVVSGTPTAFGDRSVTFQASSTAGTVTRQIPFRVDAKTSITITAPTVMRFGDFAATATATSPGGVPTGSANFFLNGAAYQLVDGSVSVSLPGSQTPQQWIGTTQTMTATYFPSGTSRYVTSTTTRDFYTYGSYSVDGRFLQNNAAGAGVSITLEKVDGTVVDSTVTDTNGRYSLEVAPPTTVAEASATYRIAAVAKGGAKVYYVLGNTANSVTGTAATASLTGPTQWRRGVDVQTFHANTIPVFTDDQLATPRVGSVYSDGLAASDTAGVGYLIASGALPAGLTLNRSTGAITGVPTSTAPATFTIAAYGTPGFYGYAERSYSITPLRAGIVPTFTDETVAQIVTGRAVTDGVVASGDPTLTYTITAGDLPSGLSLDAATGAITGTTYQGGAYEVTIRVANEFGSDETTVEGVVLYASTTVVTAPATSPIDDIRAEARVSGSGGAPTGTLTFTAFGGPTYRGLSDGAALFRASADGGQAGVTLVIAAAYPGDAAYAASSATTSTYLYGSDTVTGVVTENGEPVEGATVRVHGAGGVIATDVTDADGRYSITVDVSTVALAKTTYTVSATAPDGDVSWFSAGASTTGAAPTEAQATVSGPTQWLTGDSRDLHFTSAPQWTDSALGQPREGTVYTDGVTATTIGTAPAYEVSSGTLPAGLALDPSTGAITGTPLDQVPALFTIRAFTAYGSIEQAFAVTPLRPGIVPTFTDATLGGFAVDVRFDDAVEATGDPTIEYSISGIVPAGVGINPVTGEITGTPLYNGPYEFTVRAENEFGFAELDFEGWVDAVPAADVEMGFTPGTTIDQASVSIAADGLQQGSEYTLTMYSTPRVLLSGTVGAFRSFSETVNLPADTPVGAHRLELRAVAADGTVLTALAWFTLLENGRIGAVSYDGPLTFTPTVQAAAVTPAALASAGIAPELPVALALLLLLAGVVLTRRRRTA